MNVEKVIIFGFFAFSWLTLDLFLRPVCLLLIAMFSRYTRVSGDHFLNLFDLALDMWAAENEQTGDLENRFGKSFETVNSLWGMCWLNSGDVLIRLVGQFRYSATSFWLDQEIWNLKLIRIIVGNSNFQTQEKPLKIQI